MSKNQIHHITPIQERMKKAEAEPKIKKYLSGILKPENIIYSGQVAKIETANTEISVGDTLPEPTTPEQEEMIRFMEAMKAQSTMPTTMTKGRSYQIIR